MKKLLNIFLIVLALGCTYPVSAQVKSKTTTTTSSANPFKGTFEKDFGNHIITASMNLYAKNSDGSYGTIENASERGCDEYEIIGVESITGNKAVIKVIGGFISEDDPLRVNVIRNTDGSITLTDIDSQPVYFNKTNLKKIK